MKTQRATWNGTTITTTTGLHFTAIALRTYDASVDSLAARYRVCEAYFIDTQATDAYDMTIQQLRALVAAQAQD